MTDAQRKRDGALRRLRLANRGGVAASVAGAVVVMGLAHHATPMGKSRTAAQIITRTVAKSDPVTPAAVRHRPAVRHGSRTDAAPAVVTTPRPSTAAPPPASAPAAAPATITPAPAPVQAQAPAPVAPPVISGGS